MMSINVKVMGSYGLYGNTTPNKGQGDIIMLVIQMVFSKVEKNHSHVYIDKVIYEDITHTHTHTHTHTC